MFEGICNEIQLNHFFSESNFDTLSLTLLLATFISKMHHLSIAVFVLVLVAVCNAGKSEKKMAEMNAKLRELNKHNAQQRRLGERGQGWGGDWGFGSFEGGLGGRGRSREWGFFESDERKESEERDHSHEHQRIRSHEREQSHEHGFSEENSQERFEHEGGHKLVTAGSNKANANTLLQLLAGFAVMAMIVA